MDTIECINSKRSIRVYEETQIPYETVMELLTLGTKASTGSNHQPWGFAVIQDTQEIEDLSKNIKVYLLENLEKYPYLSQYETWLQNEKYSIFNNASTLIVVYGNTDSHWYIYDCTLAAGNIMLAAYSKGIGTCWIGFAEYYFNTPEFKKKYKIPENYELVAPLSCGYIKGSIKPPERKPPVVFNR